MGTEVTGGAGGGRQVPEARERTRKGFLDEAVSKELPNVSVGVRQRGGMQAVMELQEKSKRSVPRRA